jgi:hypothetical protein
LFKRFAEPGQQLDDDWLDALHEKVRDEGTLVVVHEWNSDNPGAGAGLVSVYAFKDLFFVDDEVSDGAYETFSDAADDCMFLQVNDTTVRLWVDIRFENASEES